MTDFTADHWKGPSEGVLIKANESRFPPLLHVGITRGGVQADHTTISTSDAHKLADWIKENIPEPPPAPPEWRIVIGEERVALMIGLVSMGVIGSDGIVRDYGVSEYDGVTPELHKEMICALLDAHYEMHKGDS